MDRGQKVFFVNCEDGLLKLSSRVELRYMDFLNIPWTTVETDASARYSQSGLNAGFSGHPCPEIARIFAEY